MDTEQRFQRLERDMHMLMAKMAVWEVANATLLEFLARGTQDPRQAITTYREAVKLRVAQISHERWADDKAWMKAVDACHEEFEQLLKFTFDGDFPEKPLN